MKNEFYYEIKKLYVLEINIFLRINMYDLFEKIYEKNVYTI